MIDIQIEPKQFEYDIQWCRLFMWDSLLKLMKI